MIVLADRGLYARWLFQRIVRWAGIAAADQYRRDVSASQERPLSATPRVGAGAWYAVGRHRHSVGGTRRLNCTLLARWDESYHDPWLLLTDLAPSAGEACWHGLRAWIEQGFKITKRGGWQWQRTV